MLTRIPGYSSQHTTWWQIEHDQAIYERKCCENLSRCTVWVSRQTRWLPHIRILSSPETTYCFGQILLGNNEEEGPWLLAYNDGNFERWSFFMTFVEFIPPAYRYRVIEIRDWNLCLAPHWSLFHHNPSITNWVTFISHMAIWSGSLSKQWYFFLNLQTA